MQDTAKQGTDIQYNTQVNTHTPVEKKLALQKKNHFIFRENGPIEVTFSCLSLLIIIKCIIHRSYSENWWYWVYLLC